MFSEVAKIQNAVENEDGPAAQDGWDPADSVGQQMMMQF